MAKEPIAAMFVVCRKASDALAPGCKRGYFCRACGIEVQVSPDGQRQVQMGGNTYCNPCGITLADRHAKRRDEIIYIENPLARAAMDKIRGEQAARQMPNQPAPPPADDFTKTLYTKGPITIEMLPSGKLDAFQNLQLTIPERPLYLVCDCCLEKTERLWIWRHRGFCVYYPPSWRMRRVDLCEGAWGFCVFCKSLWERREIKTLAARVATLNPKTHSADSMERMFSILPEVIHGESEEWQSGQAYPKLEAK